MAIHTPLARRRDRRSRSSDQGFTLIELLVSMTIFAVLLAVMMSVILAMTKSMNKTQSVGDAAAQGLRATQALDKQLRYADWVNPSTATASAPSIISTTSISFEGLTNAGVVQCYQWRLSGGLLQQRSWTSASTTASYPTASSPSLDDGCHGCREHRLGAAVHGDVPANGCGEHRLQSGRRRPCHGREEPVRRPRRDEAGHHLTQQQLSSWERAMHQRRHAVIARLARRAHDAEEGVAMLLALMIILMLLSISITVAGVTLSQVKPSQLDRKTTVTESAAEAGFDIALNRIRAANTGVLGNRSIHRSSVSSRKQHVAAMQRGRHPDDYRRCQRRSGHRQLRTASTLSTTPATRALAVPRSFRAAVRSRPACPVSCRLRRPARRRTFPGPASAAATAC